MDVQEKSEVCKPSLAIFANFHIDNEERYLRMCDSLLSFKDIKPEQWIINIRGKYQEMAAKYLKENIQNNLFISFKCSKSGWFKDSRELEKIITTDMVMIWIEDHVCQVSHELLNRVVKDFYYSGADQLLYSWWNDKNKKYFDLVDSVNFKYVTTHIFDNKSLLKINNDVNEDFYIISLLSIMRKNFFSKILFSKKPYLKRWPKYTPFDFEKKVSDNVVIGITCSLPKMEIFASIDDDGGEEGYSLISRGRYPNRVTRDTMKEMEYSKDNKFTKYNKLLPGSPFVKSLKSNIMRIIYSLT